MASVPYAPYIEGVIPAFITTELLVPFEHNRMGQGNGTFYVKILDNNNTIKGSIIPHSEIKNNIVKFNLTSIKSNLSKGEYYKIQIAYSEEGSWSSVGVGKYLGESSNEYVTLELPYLIVIKCNKNDKMVDIPYSVIINNKEYYFRLVSYEEDNIQCYEMGILINNINDVDQNVQIKTVNGRIDIITLDLPQIEFKQLSKEEALTYTFYSLDGKKWDILTLDPPVPPDEAEEITQFNLEVQQKINKLTNSLDKYYLGDIYYNETDDSYEIRYHAYEAEYEDMSLIGLDGKVLNIKYNPKVSSFKTTIQEQKQDTIGGKYPIFQRNGNLAYKEFSINGLISYHMDNNEFMPEYESKNKSHNLSEENIALERKFKFAVLDWLNDGKPKIFRSSTEGIYLVRLMNVSLTPEDKLGRMLHSFQATAYQVGEIKYEDLLKNGYFGEELELLRQELGEGLYVL